MFQECLMTPKPQKIKIIIKKRQQWRIRNSVNIKEGAFGLRALSNVHKKQYLCIFFSFTGANLTL